MKREVGIWIDHREAFVVFAGAGAADTEAAETGVAKHVKFSGHAGSEGGGEDQRDRNHAGHMTQFYDEVISHLRDSESIFVFGPGEAKGELEKRLAHAGLAKRVVGVESADKMTDRQIAAKVNQHFSH